MKELIPYASRVIGTETVPTVDGRDIHSFLGIGKDYTSWIRAQIKRAHLIENRDYIIFTQKGENSPVGRPGLEYFLTFDASKHIGMLSNTARGHEVREYFIKCEHEIQAQAAAAPAMRIPQTRYPDTQAIIALALSVDETRKMAEDAVQAAEDARSKAVLALQGQQWTTIRQYIAIHGLTRQLPAGLQRDYGRWLTGLCRERGTPLYQQHSMDGWEEQTYPVSVIQETLGGWLARRNGQGVLKVVQ